MNIKAVSFLAAVVLSIFGASLVSAGTDFYKQDLRNETEEVAKVVAQKLSEDKLTFLVYGGNKKLMMSAYRTAQKLDDESIPVALILALDRDTIEITMHVDFYTKGGTRYGVTTADNDKNTTEGIEEALYEQAMKAYNEDFGTADSDEQNLLSQVTKKITYLAQMFLR